MAIGGVVIQFIADTTKAVRGIGQLTGALSDVDDDADDASRSLKDVQRAMDQTGTDSTAAARDLGKTDTALDSVADEAESAARRMRTATADMGAGVADGARDIDTETGNIKTSMKEAGAESGAEFIGNLAEGIGSGSANVTDVVQGTLGGLTNLAASIGGAVGIAAGAAAAGVGLVFTAVKAESEKAKKRVDDLAAALEDLGETSSTAAKQIIWDTWLTTIKETDGALDNIVSGLRDAGVKGDQFKAAIEGDETAQREVLAAVKETGTKIGENVKKTGEITPKQQKTLENLADIREELVKQNSTLEDTQSAFDTVEYLTGQAESNASDWAEEQRKVYNETHKIKEELKKIPNNIPVNVIVTRKDKNGNPSKLGPGQLSAGVVGMAAMAAPPITVNVYAQTSAAVVPDSPRALVAMLESHNVRMGRRPGVARAVAW